MIHHGLDIMTTFLFGKFIYYNKFGESAVYKMIHHGLDIMNEVYEVISGLKPQLIFHLYELEFFERWTTSN